MRNLSLSIAVLAALAACGPSDKEISMAKQARYQGDKATLFEAARLAAEDKHKIIKADPVAMGFQTFARWYSRDGMVSPGTDNNMQDVPSDAIRISLIVRLLADGDKWIVNVEPTMMRRISGSPQPQPLDPKDPSVPGWVSGQVDGLQFEIHQALKPYLVQTPGGLAPGPEAPATAPAADAVPAPPADPAAPVADPAPAP